VGYDIYDVYDLGEFDQKGGVRTHWGTKDELLELVNTAKDHGVVTYVDAVLNHKFGADRTEKFGVTEVDPNDRTKEISDLYDIEVISSEQSESSSLIQAGVDGIRLSW
jgi:alpha-amylase